MCTGFLDHYTQNNVNSKKFYIKLLPNCINLGTPWFNITAKDSKENLKLMKKSSAEKLKYVYVDNNGESYYQCDKLFSDKN
jgi:hypothetical protein